MQENTHTRSLNASRKKLLIGSAIILAGIDAAAKLFAIRNLPPDSTALRVPFDLALHKNPGIAFDIAVPLWCIVPITLIVCFTLIVLAKRMRNTAPLRAIALIWISVGALGNAIDRVLNGFTTDYIILFGRTAINISDILILTGAIGYLYYSKRQLPEGATH